MLAQVGIFRLCYRVGLSARHEQHSLPWRHHSWRAMIQLCYRHEAPLGSRTIQRSTTQATRLSAAPVAKVAP